MKIFTFALLIMTTCILHAQVVINEFSAANHDTHADNYGEYEDWIELYNTGNATVDLSGYHLSDNTNNPSKWALPNGTNINANDYLLIWCSNRDEISYNNLHADFKITQTRAGEEVVFADPMGNILDSNNIDIPNQRNHSYGRMTDGGSDWGVLLSPTPGTANVDVKAPYASKPVLMPEAGFYNGSVTVEIATPDTGVTIYYTTDGSVPTTNSMIYTAPFVLEATAVIKAIAFSDDPNIPPSFVDFHTYFIDENHTVKVISISGDEITDLMNGAGNSYYGPDINFPGALELFDENKMRVADATGEMNKHGNDSWAYPQRGIDFITRDEFGDDYAVKNEIFDMFNSTNRDKFQRLILKAGANDNYPYESGGAHIRDAYVQTLSQQAGLELDERSYEPCVIYVDGKYWGVYEIREKVDDNDFTKYYYAQGRNDIQFIKTWGATWAEYGGNQALADWNTLHTFILNNDMTDAANYANVEQELNVQSMIDYMIINTHIVAKDWLSWNTAWWRGLEQDGNPDAFKWRYTLWDMDATFGHYINYSNIPDISPNSDPCNNESPVIDDPEGHTEMLTALLQNDEFYALYINRYADLNNTYFTCDYMNNLLDSMINRIAPEMVRHTTRWGGDVNGWMTNVQELKDFINTRCTIINEGIEDCYDVEGPYNLTVIVEPLGAGDVRVNTLVPISYPYNADYFAGVPITLEAIPDGLNIFDYWEPLRSTLNPGTSSINVGLEMTNLGDTIVAHFIEFECPAFNIIPNITGADCSSANGSASIIVTGGAGPYSYQWDDNADEQTTPTATALFTGNYDVTITDNSGCEETFSVTIPSNGGTLAIQVNASDALCGSPFGTANVTPTGGTAPFTYQWNDPQNQSIADPDLAPGSYNVTVTDAAGCTAIDGVTIDSTDELIVETNSEDITCFGENNGTASVSTLGNFEYLWSNNSTASGISNLAAGSYTVTVTQSSCTTIETVTIQEPTPFNININTIENACSANGSSATALVSGGTNPYTYAWSNGGNTSGIGGLENGTYTLTVTDANGCADTQSISINATSNAPTLGVEQTNISCNGNTDGAIDLTLNNGTPPFTYNWSNGATTEDINNLPPENYTLIVTDANGCIAVTTVTISEPDVLSLVPESMPSSGNDGWAAVNVNGGTPPYIYTWSNGQNTQVATGLSVGTYTVMVTDANGCTVNGSVEVSPFTGIIDLAHLTAFDLYPNPSDGQFVLHLQFDITQTATIQIFNTLGQEIYYLKDTKNSFIENIDISDRAIGTYFVNIHTEKGRAIQKMLLAK